ncbi:hypothetical protein GGR46_004030 [Sphingomonas kyeonggiensis]|uniref:Uncharacterized protein n=1 Tax=Sphingomonas kyeonggiensis TaxID=1268553 RepID=A0A7W6JVR8_9SPHN|nr:hypothetical protein [Sphingomonas kyeonggiensis]
MTRIEDRDVSLERYRAVIQERVDQFKAAIVYDYHMTA